MTPLIEVGQVWTRRSNGRQIEVMEVDEEWEDVTYRDVNTRRTGSIFAFNMHHRYTLAAPSSLDAAESGAERDG